MLSHFNIEEQKYQHAKHQLAEEDGHELRHHFSRGSLAAREHPLFATTTTSTPTRFAVAITSSTTVLDKLQAAPVAKNCPREEVMSSEPDICWRSQRVAALLHFSGGVYIASP